jgi:hypothetical protein
VSLPCGYPEGHSCLQRQSRSCSAGGDGSLDGRHETKQKIFYFAVVRAAHSFHVSLVAPRTTSTAQFNCKLHDWCLRELRPRPAARMGCTQLHEEASRDAFKAQSKASSGAFHNSVKTTPGDRQKLTQNTSRAGKVRCRCVGITAERAKEAARSTPNQDMRDRSRVASTGRFGRWQRGRRHEVRDRATELIPLAPFGLLYRWTAERLSVSCLRRHKAMRPRR